MKFAIVALALVAAVSAQTSPFPGQYYPGQYNPGQYSAFNNQAQYNPFNRKNPYTRYTTPQPFRPFFSSTTPAPLIYSPSTLTPTPAPVVQRVIPAKVTYGDSPNAQIVKFSNEVGPDGSYAYAYETDNGISAQESGAPKRLGGNPEDAPVVSQGSFAYTSPEGVPVVITYVADENGFQPSGDSIPVPPPIPEQIVRALEYIARNAKPQ